MLLIVRSAEKQQEAVRNFALNAASLSTSYALSVVKNGDLCSITPFALVAETA
jgi:hypothetical protein